VYHGPQKGSGIVKIKYDSRQPTLQHATMDPSLVLTNSSFITFPQSTLYAVKMSNRNSINQHINKPNEVDVSSLGI